MATDTERSYRGTNFVVITLIVLLVMVGIYLFTAQVSDVADDRPDSAPASMTKAPRATE